MAYTAFLKDIGAPADRFLRQQGLPALCEDTNAFAPLQKVWAFFDAAGQQVDPLLGWHVGLFVGNNNLNNGLLRRINQAPTLLLALQRLIRLVRAEASHLQVGIRERDDDIIFFTHYPGMKAMPGYHCSQAYQIAVYIEIVRSFVGKLWMPPEIGIESPVAPRTLKELFPITRILPRTSMGYLAIPRSFLPLSHPDVAVPKDNDTDPLLLTSEFGYAEVLQSLLRPYLSEGYPNASLAADLMDTSVRSLARKLKSEGKSYRALVDDLRFTEARRQLRPSSARISDVAASVGFSDTSHFARMFRRIGGLSPREFRRTMEMAPKDSNP